MSEESTEHLPEEYARFLRRIFSISEKISGVIPAEHARSEHGTIGPSEAAETSIDGV
jgi:hypothetical protein